MTLQQRILISLLAGSISMNVAFVWMTKSQYKDLERFAERNRSLHGISEALLAFIERQDPDTQFDEEFRKKLTDLQFDQITNDLKDLKGKS